MSDSKQMPRLKPQDYERLDDIQKMYIKRFEKYNVNRAYEHVAVRSKKRWIGGFLGLAVVSIYLYTTIAIKQEKFGEEFDQRITDQPEQPST